MVIYWTLLSVIFVSLLSLIGAVLLVVKKQYISQSISTVLAFSSGVLLGSTFLDLIPESIAMLGDSATIYILAGIVTFFTIEKLLKWHHHIEGDHADEEKTVGYLSLIGDAIHNFVDGTIIAAAFLVSIPLGISVTVAVIAHEVPHELADFTILIHSGFTSTKALWFNFLSATTAVAGALFIFLVSSTRHTIITYLVPFAAGNFLYIAMSDLIPELHRRRSRLGSIIHIVMLIAGIVLMSLLPTE